MDYQKWTITFSNPDWLESEVVCEATNEELIDMTDESYEFREMLNENEVVGSLISFWEGWCDMNEIEDYEGKSLGGPTLTKLPYQKETIRKEMIQGWEEQITIDKQD